MSSLARSHGRDHSDRVLLYALQAVPAERSARRRGADLRVCRLPAGDGDASPDHRYLRRLADRRAAAIGIALGAPRAAHRAETGGEPASSAPPTWTEPEWVEVAPGISVKLLATDTERDRVSMLVRLAPGVEYPPHRHAGVEELHLLDGELMIDDKKLYPGDYIRSDAGSADDRVWSETGCTCVLITSPSDVLR